MAEFTSAVAAVECAAKVQAEIASRNARLPDGRCIVFRIGINIGDVIVEGDDIFGDGVNVAARLEQISEANAILVSEALYNQVKGKTDLRFREMGERQLKNISEPVRVYRVSAATDSAAAAAGARAQTIQFCQAPDGVTLAYATVGSGPPLVKTANWLNHLEFDWVSPLWRPYFEQLSRDHLLVRYDERGNGLSDWDADDLSFEAMVRDLEAVVDAAGLERFALLGISQGSAVSVAYAVRHPQRVSHLVFLGGYAQGYRSRGNPEEIKRREGMLALVEAGWGTNHPAFHQIFASLYLPDGTPDHFAWWIELQRVCTSPRNAVRLLQTFSNIDVRNLLPKVTAPTLIMHSKGDAVVPFEAGRRLASGIPGARFVPLESRNHILLSQEPAWAKFVEELRAFLA